MTPDNGEDDVISVIKTVVGDHEESYLDLYGIPYLRFATNGSGEKEKLVEKLTELIKG